MNKTFFITFFFTSVVTLAVAYLVFNVSRATLVIKTDTRCQLSINGVSHGWLEVQSTLRAPVEPGEQLIECAGDNRRVEQTEIVEASRQEVVQLVLPPKLRFQRVAEGVSDNEQNLIWAQADNGSDINWNDATEYCSSLGSGWTLPSSAALVSMYDATGKFPVSYAYASNLTARPATTLIKISGLAYWSREQDRYASSKAWSVSLRDGTGLSYPIDFPPAMRALCVRRS
jgi:hypothetical protein